MLASNLPFTTASPKRRGRPPPPHPMHSWRAVHPREHPVLQDATTARRRVVTVCLTLGAARSPRWVRETVVPRLLSHPRFAAVPVRTAPTSFAFEPVRDFAFDSDALDRHVIPEAPISPEVSDREQLRRYHARLSAIASAPLRPAAPLWRLHVFPRWALDPTLRPTSTHLVLRVHAALADALPLLTFLLASVPDVHPNRLPPSLMLPHVRARPSDIAATATYAASYTTAGAASIAVTAPSAAHPHQEEHAYAHSRTRRRVSGLIPRPRAWAPRLAAHAIDDWLRLAARPLLLHRTPPCALTRPGSPTAHQLALIPPNLLDPCSIARAADRLGVASSELLFAALAGALRAVLGDLGDDPCSLRALRAAVPVLAPPPDHHHHHHHKGRSGDRGRVHHHHTAPATPSSRFANSYSFHSAVSSSSPPSTPSLLPPAAASPAAAQRLAASLLYGAADFVAPFATASVPLCVEQEQRDARLRRAADALRRARKIRPGWSSQRAHAQHDLLLGRGRMRAALGGGGGGDAAGAGVGAAAATAAAAMFSTVVGPSDSVCVAGAEVTEVVFVPGAETATGVSVGVLAYDGTLSAAISTDPTRVECAGAVADALVGEVEALVAMSFRATTKPSRRDR